MTWQVIAAAVGSVLVGLGSIATALIQSRRNFRRSKHDERIEWKDWATEMRAALKDERATFAAKARASDERLAGLQESLEARDTAVRARDYHIQALRDQIFRGEPPPPVAPPFSY